VGLAALGRGVTRDQGVDQAAGQPQGAATDQDDANVSPVTRFDPAVNAQDLAGLGSFLDEGSNDQGIRRDNRSTATPGRATRPRPSVLGHASDEASGGAARVGSQGRRLRAAPC
jgi:hypothetical protein